MSNIYKYYLAYRMIAEQREEREKAKEAVKQGEGKLEAHSRLNAPRGLAKQWARRQPHFLDAMRFSP